MNKTSPNLWSHPPLPAIAPPPPPKQGAGPVSKHLKRIVTKFVFASALLLAIGAVSLSGINTAHAQEPTVTDLSFRYATDGRTNVSFTTSVAGRYQVTYTLANDEEFVPTKAVTVSAEQVGSPVTAVLFTPPGYVGTVGITFNDITYASSTIATPPSPPTLVAGEITDTSIAFSWTAQRSATEYLIYRDATLLTTTSDLSYIHTGLTPDTEYSYSAESRYGTATSPPSVPLTVSTIAAPADNTAPSITTSAALRHAENDVAAVTTLSATDAEGDTITWSLTGTDAGLFAVDATSGLLTFNTPPNFEDAQDEDGDNSYQVTVTATDDGTPSESSTLEVTVRVTNKNEPGRIGPITGTAQVGQTLTAGEVTDPDGIITSIEYEWGRALPGERHLGIRGAQQRTYTLVADDIGNTIEVFASYQDGFGFDADERDVTSAPTAVVIAAPVNQPPVIDGIDDLNVVAGTLVTLTFHSATDPDGNDATLTYRWTQAGGTPDVTLSGADTATATFTAPSNAMSLSFRLTVTDEGGASSGWTTNVVVTAAPVANQPPVADAGDDFSVTASTTGVTLDGSDSTDSDGTIATYAWVHTSTGGVAPSTAITVTPDSTNPAMATFTAPDTAAELVFTLTVTDDDAATNVNTDTNTVTITVTAPADTTAPLIVLTGPDTVILTEEGTYTEQGATAEDDVDGTVDVTIGGNVMTETEGTYTVTYNAMDAAGNPATQVTRTVIVQGALTFSNPLRALTSNGATVDGVTYAKDGDILTLNFVVNQALENAPTVTIAGQSAVVTKGSGNDYTATYTVVAAEVSDGAAVYDLGAMAAAGNPDNGFDLREATSAVQIDVTAPTVNFGTIAEGEVEVAQEHDITFSEAVTGLARGDFSSTGVAVTVVSGVDNAYTLTLIPSAIAFTLTLDADSVTDAAGNGNAEAIASGTALPGNQFPIANAGAAQDVTTGATVTLDGSGSSDPDSDALTYSWTHTSTDSGAPSPLITLTNPTTASPTFTAPATAAVLVFTLRVTDGTDASTGTVTITVTAPVLSADADLSSLTISEGTLPTFAAATTSYAVDVDNDVASVTLTPTTADTAASVTVDGATVTSTEASNPIDLAPGVAKDIRVVVTAEDGTEKPYTVSVTRAENTAPSITGGQLVGRDENGATTVATYTATDAEGDTITWSVTGADAGFFTIAADPGNANLGVLTFNTVPDFETQSTYSVTIVATDDGEPSMFSERAVTVTLENVDEIGTIGTIDGVAQVGMTLTAPLAADITDPDGAVVVTGHSWNGAGTTTAATYAVVAGDLNNTITVTVTYTDGQGTGKMLTTAATSAVVAADVILSADADLSALTISAGTLPAFAAATTSYAVDVDNDVASVTLTPTTSDTAASVTVAGTAVTSATASGAITLNVGANAIAIVVTAQDGTTEKTYTVTIDRGANTAPRITTAATQSVAENTPTTTPVVTFAADDDESNTITWALTGADAGDFTLNAASGALTFNALPNYETKRSYAVTVTATDNGTPNMPSAPHAVTIAVTNVDEEGSVVIGGDLLVGATLTATVTEEDGAASLTYQWQSAASGGTYTDITSATSATYILAATDAGKTLQVVAMYNDGFGDKTVTSTMTGAVPAAPVPNQPPVANAGDLQTVAIGATVTLDGSGSTDSDGTIQSYEWVHTTTDGVAPATAITVANGVTSTFTAPDTAVDSDLVFTLTVTDDGGVANINTDTNTVTITVTAPVANIAPTANAGADQSVTASTTGVTLDGTDSTDSDGTIATYAWVHTSTDDAPPATAITVANGVTSTFTAPDAAAELVFTLTVTDDDAATHSDTVTITVTAPAVTTNQPPVANAGALQTVAIGATVTLDGSGSTDSDGTIATYAWVHTTTDDAPPTTPITVANGVTSTFTAPDAAAELVFTLTVTDDDAATHSDTVTITVTAPVVTTPFAVTIPALGKSTVGNSASVGIDFARAVTGLETGDFSVSNGAVNSIAPATGSGTTFVVTYTPITTGAVTLTLAANAVTDGDGNPNLAASATGSAAVAATQTTSKPSFTATTTIAGLTTAEFDEPKFEMGIATLLTIPVGDVSIISIAAGSVVVDYEVVADTVAARDTRAMTLDDATDAALRAAIDQNIPSNAAVTTTSPVTATPDTTAPTVLLGTIAAGVVGTAQTHDITFSEVVTGLTVNDFSATGATVDSVSGSGDTYTITFTPTEEGFTLTLAANSVEDVTGIAGPAAAITATGTAVDATAPEITLLGASPVEVHQGSTFTDPGATATDGVDGDLSASIVVGGDPVDTDTAGDYTITYDVSDAADNAAETVTRIVRVVIVRDLARLNAVILPEVARSMADQHVSAIVQRLEQARLSNIAGTAGGASFGGAGNLTELIKTQGRAIANDQFDWKRVLAGSAFVLPLNGAGGGAAEKAQDFTFWGAGDYRSMEGAEGVNWDGDLFSLQLGLDAQLNARTILGVAISKSQARLDYTDPRLGASGDYDLDMTSVHPYLGWAAGGLDFWATAGYGDGELEISEDRAPGEAIPTSDLSMQTFALGASGILMETGRTTLRLKGEAMSSTVELDGNAQITAVTHDVSRVRMALEATRVQALDSGAQFESSLEAGMRFDGGDGETGAGAELGASLRYARLGGGLVIEGKARALVGGEAEEWGLSGAISFQPSTNGRGLSFSLTPGYGVTSSGVQQLWQQGLDDGLGGASHGASSGSSKGYSPSLEVRLDYGMHALRGPGLMTPYTELSLGDSGDTYRLGLQWQRSKLFDLKLVTERKEGTTRADHRIYLEGELAF